MTNLFDAKPFIIAEVGSNWQTLEQCRLSIQSAKVCGADAVKFQAFTYRALYGSYPEGKVSVMLPHELPLAWLPELKKTADACDIEFMCTAFSPELVAAVDPFVSVHKIASSDAAWPQMLDAVAATGKRTLISFGGKSEAEQKQAMARLCGAHVFGRDSVVPLYCIAAYPADCAILPDFCRDGAYDGFSDHTLGYTAAIEAARRGAIVIEKHFTAFPDLDTPDRPHSLRPDQFIRMVNIIRRGEAATSEEDAMILRHNRRLIATCDVEVGTPLLVDHNFGAYRAQYDDTRGLSPFAWEQVQGKKSTKAIKRGEAIGEGDFA